MYIADFIKSDLEARLKSGMVQPAQLTIDALAEHYDVSHTPIRSAIAELISEGLLEKGSNRRLIASVNCPPQQGELPPAEPPEPLRDPYETISNDLVKASLEGDSIYLREEVTAEKYDVSRSVIRNIFHRLAGEGMLDHIPRRGWRLRAFRQDDLKAFVEVRESLELKALTLAFPRLDSQELRRILDANVYPANPSSLPLIDESLHNYLIKLSGNVYIKDFFVRQGRYYELLFHWEDHDLDAAIETVRQHREILTFLLNRDEQSARRSLSYHILNNHPILTQISGKANEQDDR
ncbi:GntR family transcriptional regulator [Schlesneria sp. T3-172]|uniref:GntR family transcriptional regulator n=1 Tax=Schlesneria sphaerica TaxID=3373610 RepID=UPI0037CB2976